MGRIVHEGLMVSGCLAKELKLAHGVAVRKFGEHAVSEVKKSKVNCYLNFAVFPCGSKFGWAEQEEHSKLLKGYCLLLDELCLDYAVSTYGETN